MEKVKGLQTRLLPHRLLLLQTAVLLMCSFMIFTAEATVVHRFNDRSLYINDATPGATTQYKVSLTYNNQGFTDTVGSIDLLFCYDPIPSETISPQNPVDHHPCVAPAGLDVSNAQLSGQFGVTGYSILSQSTNEIILTRTPGTVAETPSVYTFDNVVNPTDASQSFAIRLSDYPTTDASGPLINLGSVLSQVSDGITLETQVPPVLAFCVAAQVDLVCADPHGGNYSDLGDLAPDKTLTTTSQMAAGTNATGGYVITANGPSLEAGTHVIDPLPIPTVSAQGNSQFGINLVANTSPQMGADPDGPFTNATVAQDYSIPNQFTYRDGDVVASAPNVSLIRRFTVSYLVNSPPDIRAGVYTTTITFICTGRF
jgi:hypothetical protein